MHKLAKINKKNFFLFEKFLSQKIALSEKLAKIPGSLEANYQKCSFLAIKILDILCVKVRTENI